MTIFLSPGVPLFKAPAIPAFGLDCCCGEDEEDCPPTDCECIPLAGGVEEVGDATVTISGSSGMTPLTIALLGCISCFPSTVPNIDGSYVVSCDGDDVYCLWHYVCTNGTYDAYYQTRITLRWYWLNTSQYELQLILQNAAVAITAGDPNPRPTMTLGACPSFLCGSNGNSREVFFRITTDPELCGGTPYNSCPVGALSLHSNSNTSPGGGFNGFSFAPLTIGASV